MQTNTRTMLCLIPPVLMFITAGCTVEEPIEAIAPPGSPSGLVEQTELARRFQNPDTASPTAVESAMQLSAKYAKLTEETAALRQEYQLLLEENRRLKEQLVPCRGRLQQTQKELAEANDLLVEMRIELNNWKTDVIGFRNEMRDADKTQLDALLKILTVLGGEVRPEAASGENEPTTPSASADPEPSRLPSARTEASSGESNG